MSDEKRERRNATQRAWRAANPHKGREYEDPVKRMLYNAKARARARNVPFNLLPEDIHIPSHCPVLGLALKMGGSNSTDASVTLDRVRPELGYVRGNVVVMSHLANRIKNSATLDQVRAVADWMEQHEVSEHP